MSLQKYLDHPKSCPSTLTRMRGQVKTLFLHPSVHSVNIHDPDACRRTLDTMVQSDSLPKKNAYEGRVRDTPWKKQYLNNQASFLSRLVFKQSHGGSQSLRIRSGSGCFWKQHFKQEDGK